MEPRRALLIAAWLMATSLMMFVTYRAVSLVGDAVTDQPTAATFLTSSTTLAETTTPEPANTTPSTLADPTDDSPPGSFAPPSSSTSSTTAPRTSTTVAGPTSTTRATPTTGPFTIPSSGGSVTVLCHGDSISFSGAVPAAGYAAEVESTGPGRVEVEFDSPNLKWEVRVECSGGVPEEEIKQSD
ncbi:MAG: hypothetical protein OEO77_03105 [Acidimicrobiia bacterium]|nr:hypothetical protein [Acidimicrobiia bacterium]